MLNVEMMADDDIVLHRGVYLCIMHFLANEEGSLINFSYINITQTYLKDYAYIIYVHNIKSIHFVIRIEIVNFESRFFLFCRSYFNNIKMLKCWPFVILCYLGVYLYAFAG